MKHLNRIIVTLLILSLFCFCSPKPDLDQMLTKFFDQKRDIVIVVTDSGLGGLSVAADVAASLPQSGVFENVRIIFFNSLFHNKSGYNYLKTEAEKIQIFNTILNVMQEKYHPDLLLIACNTLSVLYPKTPFSGKVNFPVIGIVERGVELIAEQFDKNSPATGIIFATETTISSHAHKNLLISRGYLANRVIEQPCTRLAGSIERGHDSEETIGYIKQYVAEAITQLNHRNSSIFASLNCTHYGYSLQQFKDAFAVAGYPEIEIIDPNPTMADFLITTPYLNRYPKTKVTVEVISKTEIHAEKKISLSKLLERISPVTASALLNYHNDPELFHVTVDTTIMDR